MDHKARLLGVLNKLAESGVLLEEAQGGIEAAIENGRLRTARKKLEEAVEDAIADKFKIEEAVAAYADLPAEADLPPETNDPADFQNGYVSSGAD